MEEANTDSGLCLASVDYPEPPTSRDGIPAEIASAVEEQIGNHRPRQHGDDPDARCQQFRPDDY
jgi:hypothetical protein